MAAWMAHWVRWGKQVVAGPQLLALLLVMNLAAYFAGLLFWYGYVMTDSTTPMWAWPFIPDCPLFGLLGGLGLLMVIAQSRWSVAAQIQGQRWLWIVALVSVAVWLSTYLPGVSAGWAQQGAMFALWSWALLVAAIWFRRPPAWLLGIFAFGQIKYGIWTITAWLLYWRSTAELFGAPHFSFDSISMTLAHIGLAAQGLLLLTYFRPTRLATVAALVWFGLSDFVDYGLGFYPAIPEQLISLEIVQWSTITVTLLLVALYWLYSFSLDPFRPVATQTQR
ncbi:MAG: DUF1405 domain-containing protein [Caldilineaceae bacterium]|nr:DUF1405 domain-containing protein [Caldilineaceae bacterium]